MNSNKPITPEQIKKMHILLSATGYMAFKQDLMDTACIDERYPTSSKDLYYVEAETIIKQLEQVSDKCDTMRKKVISLCRQAGMSINNRADMAKIYAWVDKYGHAKKGFNKYTYNELVTLVLQAENMLAGYLKSMAK